MRIAVFSTPRTGSTFACQILSNKFGLYNHNEDVYIEFKNNAEEKNNKLNLLRNKNNYVVKLFAKYFHNNLYIESNNFDWDLFDHIIITERTNIVDQMASLYNIKYESDIFNNTDHIDLDSKIIKEFYDSHKQYMQLFYEIKKTLITVHKSVYVLQYEKLQNTNVLTYLNTVTPFMFTEKDLKCNIYKSNINYSVKYKNYNELEAIVNKWNLTKM